MELEWYIYSGNCEYEIVEWWRWKESTKHCCCLFILESEWM